jgi:hypothetical protein
MLGQATVLLGELTGRGTGGVARDRLESFAQFAGNENFSSPLDTTPVDRRPTEVRIAKCCEILCALETLQRTHFHHIIAGYESWFYLEYQHASQWSVSRDELPQRADPAIGTAKFMFTVI